MQIVLLSPHARLSVEYIENRGNTLRSISELKLS